MTMSPEAVLSVEAKNAENKEFKKYTINPDQVHVLDAIFHQHYMVSRPGPNDYKARTNLVLIFNNIAKEIYGNSVDAPTIFEFGSFLMDLFCAKSDLDLSVNFMKNKVEITRQKKIQTLRKFTKKFYALQSKGYFSGVQPVLAAKVPILKVVDGETRVECDLSVDNIDGILKSQLIRMICLIDERFRILCFLMKAWAKAQNINSSKDGTLNSLSIILLVAFHLQTRQPPILPPFSSLFKDGIDPSAVGKLMHDFINCRKHNKESVAELFISLLIKLSSVEMLWPKGLCASVYNGSWISKSWNSKIAPISVEDFVDKAQNVARAVGAVEMMQIYKCIHYSLKLVFSFIDGQFDGSHLAVILFGKDDIQFITPNGAHNMLTRSIIPQTIHVQDPTKLTSGGTVMTYHNRAYPTPPNTIVTKRLSPVVDVKGEVSTRSWQNAEPFTPSNPTLAKRIHFDQTSGHVDVKRGEVSTRSWQNGEGFKSSNPALTKQIHYDQTSSGHVDVKGGGEVSTRSWRNGEGFKSSNPALAKQIHYDQTSSGHGVRDVPKAQPPPMSMNSRGQMHVNGRRVVKQPETTFLEAQREAGLLVDVWPQHRSGSSGWAQHPGGAHSTRTNPRK